MGDNRRFDLFSKVIIRNFPPARFSKVADIAGGKGQLQLALRACGYQQVTSFDKRKKHLHTTGISFRRRFFGSEVEDDFNLLIGMHPDEATDVIITEAARRQIPFAVCPCCIKPFARPFHRQYTDQEWIKHLVQLATSLRFKIIETTLPMIGKNHVIIGKPS